VISLCTISQIYIYLVGIFFGEELPFTLSALTHLRRLSIFALISFTDSHEIEWGISEIIRVVNTAPSIQGVALRFHSELSDSTPSISSLARLNWFLLDDIQSNSTGKRPHIDFWVTDEHMGSAFSPESSLALAANEALMDLVERGLITLRSELTCWGAVDYQDIGHIFKGVIRKYLDTSVRMA